MSKEKKDLGPLGSAASLLSQVGIDDEFATDYMPSDDEGTEIPEIIDVDETVINPSDVSLEDEEVIEDEPLIEDEDEEDEEEEIVDDSIDTDTVDVVNLSSEELGEMEPQLASYLEEKIYDKFGWPMEEGDEKAKDIDSIVDLLQSVVEENSKPIYSSEEIEQLDTFVKNGGSLQEYFSKRYSENLDVDKVDIEKQSDQERVLREYFRTQEFKEEKIDKYITKYDDTGILQDMAEDALETLKNNKEKNAEKLLVQQKEASRVQEERQQKFLDDVSLYIDNSKDVLGASLTKAEKERLKQNLFKVDKDGKTEFQRKYNENMISGIVESALLSTMRDKYIGRSTKKASTEAARKLKKTLQSAQKNNKLKSGGGMDDNSSSDLIRRMSRELTGK